MTVEPQMRQEDWQVRLPDFEGPFDLLLHLVRRGELDVSTMPLHEVADEYLEILAQLPEIDVEEAGEFLLVASLLVDLKVRSSDWKQNLAVVLQRPIPTRPRCPRWSPMTPPCN